MELRRIRLKPRIFILCNGELAEPQYFQDFKDNLRVHNIIIRHRKEFRTKAPWDFIKEAVKYKQTLETNGDFIKKDGDQIWCVFDVDNYWHENENEFRNGLKLAETNGLKIAWSNECFEFWFLCHFAFYNSVVPRADYNKKLTKHFKDKKFGIYEKNIKGVFLILHPLQESAIKHAKKLYVKNCVQNNPSTSVFILVKELLNCFG